MDPIFTIAIAGATSSALTAIACGIKCGGKIQRRDARIVELEKMVADYDASLIRQAGTILSRDAEITRLNNNLRTADQAMVQVVAERDAALARTNVAKAQKQPRFKGRFVKPAVGAAVN